jgi:hypothetical protein
MLSSGDLRRGSAKWDKRVERETIRNFILSASRGMLEIVNQTTERVQFIHESVREYFLHGGLVKIDGTLRGNDRGIIHQRLTQWCREYFELIEHVTLTRRLRHSGDPHEQWRRTSKSFPLLKYVADGVLRHADNATRYGMGSIPFDARLSVREWLSLKACIRETPRISPYEKHTSADTIHIFVYESYKHLVDVELSRDLESHPQKRWAHLDFRGPLSATGAERSSSRQEGRGCRFGIDLDVYMCMGSALHIARALIRRGANVNDRCRMCGSPLYVAETRYTRGTEMTDMLLDYNALYLQPGNKLSTIQPA